MTRVQLQLKIMKLLQSGPLAFDQIKVGAVMPVHMNEALRVLCDLNFIVAKKVGTVTIYHAAKKIAKKKRGRFKKHVCIKDKVLAFVVNSNRECSVMDLHIDTGASKYRCLNAMNALARDQALDYRIGLDKTGRLNTGYWRKAGLEVDIEPPDSVKVRTHVLEVISAFESTVPEIAEAIGRSAAVTHHRVRELRDVGSAFIVGKRGTTNIWSSKPP